MNDNSQNGNYWLKSWATLRKPTDDISFSKHVTMRSATATFVCLTSTILSLWSQRSPYVWELLVQPMAEQVTLTTILPLTTGRGSTIWCNYIFAVICKRNVSAYGVAYATLQIFAKQMTQPEKREWQQTSTLAACHHRTWKHWMWLGCLR